MEALEDRCLLSFLPAVSYPTGVDPRAVVTGALLGAGQPLDLVVANSSSNAVSVLLGNANSTFQPAQNFATGPGPHSVAVGDFNGDGKLDIVTANTSNLSVLLGNGNGTFQTPINISLPGEFPPGYTGSTPVPQAPLFVAVGDMNHDGRLDLVVAGETTFGAFATGNGYVNVLLGNGDGTFAQATAYLLNTSLYASTQVALADFNGDGNLDVAVLSPNDSSVSVLLGKGDGTVGAPTRFATGLTPVSLAVGDVNGDGKLDLVTANYNGDSISVLLGNGAGSFQAHTDIPLPGWSPPGYSGVNLLPLPQHPESIVEGDLNGDGKLDLAVTTTSSYSVLTGSGYYGNYYSTVTKSNVNVLLGHGDGAYTDAEIVALNGGNPYALTTGNFNSATFTDLAVADPSTNSVSVLLNGADWASTAAVIDVGGFPLQTSAGVPGTFTVRVENGLLQTTGYTGKVHFSSSDPQAVLPADYTFTAADQGMHTFSATLKTAGTQSISAADTTTGAVTGSEAGITVSPAALSRFGVGGFLSSQPIGTLGSFTVTPTDAFGNLVSGYAGKVHFTSTDPAAALPADYTFTPADAYGHSFDATFRTPGFQTLTATDTAAPSITGSQGNIEVTGASTFAVYGFPTPIVAGTAGSFTVTVYDVYNQQVIGYSGTVHFTSTDPAAALPADYTFTSADLGSHTFAATFRSAGTQAITATATANANVTGTQGGITVDAAIKALNVTGFPATVTAGVAGSFTVTARDASGNIAAWYTGTVVFGSSDSRAALPPPYIFTAADKGVHTFAATLITAGTQSITVTDTATGGLSGWETGITVNPAAASRFLITAPSSGTSGVAFALTVTVLDAYGNVVTGYIGTIHFKSTDHKATLPANYTFTAADKGVHTFTGLILRKRGSQTITITDTLKSSLTGSVIENVL